MCNTISYVEEFIQLHRGTHFYLKKKFPADFFFIFAFNGLQIVLLALPWSKDSKTVIRFEIGPREGGEKNGHTDKQTNRQNDRSQSL